MEEVIGHALWCYWEDKAEPSLDEGLPNTGDGQERKVRLSSAGWCLRIVEDDTEGEVDEDYPGTRLHQLELSIVPFDPTNSRPR